MEIPAHHATTLRVATGVRLARFAWAALLLFCTLLAYPSPAPGAASDVENIGPVVRAMCGKSIALIGETRVHGFGKSLEYKVELVRRLVDDCHYNAVFFESGLYDFANIQEQVKAGHDVTDSMIAAAIGGLWANKEVAPLIPFFRERLAGGKLYLGGMDDQLARGTWAQKEMPAALVAHLAGEEQARCRAILQKHLLWQYTDAAPYGPPDKARLLDCLDRIDAQLKGTSAPGGAAHLAMIDSLKRQFDRDFPKLPAGMDEDTFYWNGRDRSMYQNFRWLLAQLPPHSKVIVWSATVHGAKELSTVPGDEKKIPLGFYIHRDFGRRAFTLGFSAYSGSYAFVGRPVRELSASPPGSLEARAFSGHDRDSVYISRNELRKSGPIPARTLGTDFATARWDQVLDGLVIFRTERAPEYLHH